MVVTLFEAKDKCGPSGKDDRSLKSTVIIAMIITLVFVIVKRLSHHTRTK